jgi:hypothetical protein
MRSTTTSKSAFEIGERKNSRPWPYRRKYPLSLSFIT